MPRASFGPPPPDLVAWRREIADNMIFPEHHPAHGRLYVDRTDHLWVERLDPDRPEPASSLTKVHDTPTAWDVFDPRGYWLGAVELPARFYMFEIGEDYVAGIWKDASDVEFVRIHALIKPGA